MTAEHGSGGAIRTDGRTVGIVMWWAAGGVLLAGLLAASVFGLWHRNQTRTVRIAAGQRGGTYLLVGQAIATSFNANVPGVRASAIQSLGGIASIRMLEQHQAEMALIPSNVQEGDRLRLIAPLYDETLQIVVRTATGIHSPLDLRGHRVNIGATGSGTEPSAKQILQHFGIGDADYTRVDGSALMAADQLEAGTIDALFILAGMRTPVVDRLLRRNDMQLLSLGDTSRSGSALEGIRVDAPYFQVTVIPVGAYGQQPTEPIGTVSVKALLVVRGDLDDDLVQSLTAALFTDKVQLAARQHLLSRLSERYDPADSPFPLHMGADRYYRRDEPSFVQRYNDEISLALTVGALLWSAFTALRAARRQKRRGRVETLYAEAQQLAAESRAATTNAARRSVRERFEQLRSRAMDELTAERLEANESFTILQNYVNAQIAEIDHQIATAGAETENKAA